MDGNRLAHFAYDSTYPQFGHRNVRIGMSCFVSTLYVPHQLFTGSPGHQPGKLNPPYVVSGIYPVTICVRHLGQSVPLSKVDFSFLTFGSREHCSVLRRTGLFRNRKLSPAQETIWQFTVTCLGSTYAGIESATCPGTLAFSLQERRR